jgi:hypothetical protein
LWRASNPALPEAERQRLVDRLMDARRAVAAAKRAQDAAAESAARAHPAQFLQRRPGRGPVWWDDGAPDYNRHLIKNTPYAEAAPEAD